MKIKMKTTAVKNTLESYKCGYIYDTNENISEKQAETFVKAGIAILIKEDKKPSRKKVKNDEV